MIKKWVKKWVEKMVKMLGEKEEKMSPVKGREITEDENLWNDKNKLMY